MPTPNASPVGMLVDGDSVWVAEGGGGRLARLDVATRTWEEMPMPEKAEPVKLAKARDGRLWVTDGGGLGSSGGNRVLVFDPATRAFTAIPMTARGAKPMGIVAASDGNIWFTQQGANRITRIRTAGGGESDAIF
jgi:streptogramin lyase